MDACTTKQTRRETARNGVKGGILLMGGYIRILYDSYTWGAFFVGFFYTIHGGMEGIEVYIAWVRRGGGEVLSDLRERKIRY
jgi:hypothetical protein